MKNLLKTYEEHCNDASVYSIGVKLYNSENIFELENNFYLINREYRKNKIKDSDYTYLLSMYNLRQKEVSADNLEEGFIIYNTKTKSYLHTTYSKFGKIISGGSTLNNATIYDEQLVQWAKNKYCEHHKVSDEDLNIHQVKRVTTTVIL